MAARNVLFSTFHHAQPQMASFTTLSGLTGRPMIKLLRHYGLTFGINDLQFRDLRRTLAAALEAGGCTNDQIRSITSHKTREALQVYVRPDDTFAKRATGRLQRASRPRK